mgnify:CR=1 FL=1
MKTQLNITDSIEWLNKHTQSSWSRSKFYRLRKLEYFIGSWRADKSTEHFTINELKRGCKEIGIPMKKGVRYA